MGGTFDPPHIAHLKMAKRALDYLKLDEVRFVPTGRVYYKDSSAASAADRLEMVRLLIEGCPEFSADSTEVDNAEEYSYSYKTLEAMKNKNPHDELVFIMGGDSLDYIDTWKNPQRIFDCCRVAAIPRPGYTADAILKKKQELENAYKARIELVPMDAIDISSTMLRKRICDGADLHGLVTDSVAEYIKKNKIYCQRNNG